MNEKFVKPDGKVIKYADVIASRDGENFPLNLSGDPCRVVVKAIAIGIDSRLEACFVPSRGDSASLPTMQIAILDNAPVHALPGKLPYSVEFEFSPASLPVLLRRLFEETESKGIAHRLGFFILSTLDVPDSVDEVQQPEFEGEDEGLDPFEYASLWGSERSDGVLFYNFASDGGDPDFLAQFIPAIARQIEQVRDNSDSFDEADHSIRNLELLKSYCVKLLASKKPQSD